MIWDNAIKLVDIFTIASVVLVLGGSIFGYIKWKLNKRIQRSNYIKDIVVSFYQNKDYAEIFYKFDYGEPWYSTSFHSNIELQRKVDSVLTLISYICYLKETNQLSDKEFKFVDYKIDRTLQNKDVIDYIFNLYHFSKGNFSFYWLLEYAKKHYEWVNEDFMNPASENHPHYLIK